MLEQVAKLDRVHIYAEFAIYAGRENMCLLARPVTNDCAWALASPKTLLLRGSVPWMLDDTVALMFA